MTPYYGSCILPYDSTLPMHTLQCQRLDANDPAAPLRCTVSGLPIFFWNQQPLVRILFRNVCDVADVQLRRDDLVFTMSTFAQASIIPRVAQVAIKTRDAKKTSFCTYRYSLLLLNDIHLQRLIYRSFGTPLSAVTLEPCSDNDNFLFLTIVTYCRTPNASNLLLTISTIGRWCGAFWRRWWRCTRSSN